jgi:hypothetical protein
VCVCVKDDATQQLAQRLGMVTEVAQNMAAGGTAAAGCYHKKGQAIATKVSSINGGSGQQQKACAEPVLFRECYQQHDKNRSLMTKGLALMAKGHGSWARSYPGASLPSRFKHTQTAQSSQYTLTKPEAAPEEVVTQCSCVHQCPACCHSTSYCACSHGAESK